MSPLEQLKTAWALFNDAGPLANFIEIAMALCLGVSVTWGYLRRKFNRERALETERKLHSAALISTLEQQNDDLQRSLNVETAYDPHTWVAAAQRERKDGNEGRAVDILRNGLDLTGDALFQTCFDLARFHVSLIADEDSAIYLREGERMAQLACLLKSSDRGAAALLGEIQDLAAIQNIKRGVVPDDRTVFPTSASTLYSGFGADPATLVTTMQKIVIDRIDSAHFAIAERLAFRARAISITKLGETAMLTLSLRYHYAVILTFLGHFEEALHEIEFLVSTHERLQSARHPDTLATKYQHTVILEGLGRHKEALHEIEELIPIEEQVCGARHPHTLTTRFQRASMLGGLGRYKEALQEVEALLPMRQRVLGTEHPDTLRTKNLRASILRRSKRYHEALKEIEGLLPIRQRLLGAEHPDTLFSRYERAGILNDVGRYAEALQEILPLLAMQEVVLGAEHSTTLSTKNERAASLNGLKRYEEALHDVEALIEIDVRVRGAEHPNTLATRYRRAEILSGLGRHEEALQDIESLMPIEERVLGLEHPHTLALLELKENILKNNRRNSS